MTGNRGWTQLDELLNEMFTLPKQAEHVEQDDKGVTLSVDLPGHNPAGIEIKVVACELRIKSERKAGDKVLSSYSQRFTLPQRADESKIEASFEHGVLKVVVPFREGSEGRSIPVKVC